MRLDEFGIDYIEGGWPGSNPVDVAFFKEIANYHLKYARIAAFGSTHHPDNKVEEDPNLNALIASGATAGSDFHANRANAMRRKPCVWTPNGIWTSSVIR